MPKQIRSAEQFQKLAPNADECRVVSNESGVKLKLRLSRQLYTYKTNTDEAEDLIKGLKDVEVIEFTPKVEEKE
jgi:Ribosomal L38e protein family